MAIKNVIRYYGEPRVPQDVRRRRKQIQEMMRRMGTPVIFKHMYNADDVDNGIAIKSPNRSDIYNQTRFNDPLSHGVGFVSAETSPNEWVTPDSSAIVVSNTSPGAGYTPAPKYRGYGPAYLTYIILPDAAEDFFKLSETGVLLQVQTATVQMGWFPEVNDNDLMILVELDRNENITATHERYQLKMTNPVSMRGLDRRGRREYSESWGNRHIVGQSFETVLLPANNELQNVETDR